LLTLCFELQALFTQFHSRVSFGVKAECIELTAIPQVRSARARALFKAGLRTPQAVAEASVEEIASALATGGAGNRGVHVAAAKKIQRG
jgi:DNA polymerase theta